MNEIIDAILKITSKNIFHLPQNIKYENTRSNFKCFHHWEKWKKIMSDYNYIPGTQKVLSDKVTPDIEGFRDEPVVQCDFPVVENIFVSDFK